MPPGFNNSVPKIPLLDKAPLQFHTIDFVSLEDSIALKRLLATLVIQIFIF